MGRKLAASAWGWLILLGMISSMPAQTLHWTKLPALPDAEGFAGMFAGSSGGALIVAGGANFPDKRPWEGGAKVWYDTVWGLEKAEGTWKKIGKLPRPLGYGGSVTWHDELICLGGSNADGHHADVFGLRWADGKLTQRSLPSLPQPCANHCAVLVGDTIFVAGGIVKPGAVQALHTLWSLDLTHAEQGWKALDPWPGKERMLAVTAGADGAFYLFSGAALHADSAGRPEREWLKDAYRFKPGAGWEKLPDLPRVAVAAASPAPVFGGRVCIFSGDDGTKFGFKPETKHPGFPRDAFAWDFAAQKWVDLGSVPFSRATVPATAWGGGFVIPNGEERPGYRSNEVWLVKSD
jgi:N-acetylneuraminic acid mutarotase